jgi:hypothetical protein
MGLGDLIRGCYGKPAWTYPSEEEVNNKILKLKKELEEMPNSQLKTAKIYTLANQMQILRLILHEKKKKKYRPDAKGKWVWVVEEEYEGRKYK